jgi:predicted permease
VPLKRGRFFTDEDRFGGAKVVLVNETAARKFWPNGDAIGKRVGIGQGGFGDGAEVIGIVGDVRQNVDSLPIPDAYISYNQSPRVNMMIFIRTTRDPVSIAGEVRAAIREVAPRFPVFDMQAMATRAASATAQARFSATLLAMFALTALTLAIVGIYGVMSLVVSSRTREIGIRIALGADQRRVQRGVIGEGVSLVAAGAVIGLAGALLCTRVLQKMLYDLTPTDPVTYTSIVAILGATAFAASWIPARRAARVDPVEALRTEG